MRAAAEPPLQAPATEAVLPRLLRGLSAHEPMTLAEHHDVHGAVPAMPRRGGQALLIEALARAGLRGRGGGGFPTAAKLRAVAAHRQRTVLVVNATEGEPASEKDRTLLAGAPHLVLDGAVLTAAALGAEQVVLCVCASDRAGIEAAAQAIAERREGRRRAAKIELRQVPAGYIVGQETALIDFLNDGAGLPTFTPPRPSEKGVGGRPTMLSNAETFAHVALIARHGPAWFRQLGTREEPGSLLVTLSGAVASPGVYEIGSGLSLRTLVESAGGTTADLAGALLGGYGGAWVGRAQLPGLVLSDRALAPHGAALGAGVVLLLDRAACPVAETRRLVAWLAAQSTGQCGPCVNGLHAIAREFAQIADGTGDMGYEARLTRLERMVRGRGACGHPDGACRLVLSALTSFGAELVDHAANGPCTACREPSRLPSLGGVL